MIADPRCIGNRSSYEHDDKIQLSAPKASELRYLSYQHDQAITVGHINARKCSKLYGEFENFALCELIQNYWGGGGHVPPVPPPPVPTPMNSQSRFSAKLSHFCYHQF